MQKKSTLWLFLLTLISSVAFGQNYWPAPVTGYTVDAIANGVGAASTSTTGDLGSGYAFVSSDFRASSTGPAPTYSLPASGLVNSTSIPGLKFQLGDYFGNNMLRISQAAPTGTLTLTTPHSGGYVYILTTSGDGATTIDVTVTFSDNTTQMFTGYVVNDWYNASTTDLATAGIGRIKISSNGLEGNATNPHLYHMPCPISSANTGKLISSVTITKTDATAALAGIFGITLDTTLLPPCVAPTAQATNMVLTPASSNISGSFTAASPAADKYLVLRTLGSATPSVMPATGDAFLPGMTVGNAVVVSASTSTTFTDAPLPAGTMYTYTVYAYNGIGCSSPAYNTAAPLQMAASTSPNPVNGDTTWVQAHDDVHLDYYNNFDAPVNMPSGTFRKIIMVFTLGKYQCPTGSQYCGDWDYTVVTSLMTPTDTMEIGRLITPYANASAPRTPWTWKQRYYFDVTDLYPMLQGINKIRILYSGYSGGFTADVKFAFVSGTPPRNVTGVSPLWHKSYDFGVATDPIDNHVTPFNLTAPAGTQSAEMKFTVTGHGSDGNNCSEFCSKYYQVMQNGTMLAQTNIWKPTCGSNNLYPQSGTWIYNRANWCPGEDVQPASYVFNNITGGTNFTADVDFQPYTKSGTNTPSYIIGGNMVYYAGFNKGVDAYMEEVIAPSNDENNFRANPICGKPIVRIRNTGSTAITSMAFEYGVVGNTLQNYTLTGVNIAPLAYMDVTLPDLAPLDNMAASSNSVFIATIKQVNGAADEYAANDSMRQTFVTAVDWPSSFTVTLKTNNYVENNWKIEDVSGALIAQGNPTAANTTYSTPVNNLAAGCYKFTVTDTDCDGGYWSFNAGTKGTAYVYAKNAGGAYLPMANGLPSFPSSSSQDFGCGFTTYFRVGALIPIELLTFTGKADQKVNHLYWETAQELNGHHFDIEFSTTGRDFVKVAEVAARGNSNFRTSYQTTHTPGQTAPVYYYRLKLVDADGSYKYSNVISIRPSVKTFEVTSVAPNPFTEQLKVTITSTKASPAFIKLYDAQGKVYYNTNTSIKTGINNLAITDLRKLNGGLYFLEINVAGEKAVACRRRSPSRSGRRWCPP